MGSKAFRNPRTLSSALTALGTLQPRALGFLNTIDPLDTVSNRYVKPLNSLTPTTPDLSTQKNRPLYVGASA